MHTCRECRCYRIPPSFLYSCWAGGGAVSAPLFPLSIADDSRHFRPFPCGHQPRHGAAHAHSVLFWPCHARMCDENESIKVKCHHDRGRELCQCDPRNHWRRKVIEKMPRGNQKGHVVRCVENRPDSNSHTFDGEERKRRIMHDTNQLIHAY